MKTLKKKFELPRPPSTGRAGRSSRITTTTTATTTSSSSSSSDKTTTTSTKHKPQRITISSPRTNKVTLSLPLPPPSPLTKTKTPKNNEAIIAAEEKPAVVVKDNVINDKENVIDDSDNNKKDTTLLLLPSGWIELIDEVSGIPYYLYEEKGVTTWDRPIIKDSQQQQQQQQEVITTAKATAAKEKVDNDKSSSDNEHFFENNSKDIVHTNTVETVDYDNNQQQKEEENNDNNNDTTIQQQQQQQLPSGWIEIIDEVSGIPYYLNENEGITTWDRPVSKQEEEKVEDTTTTTMSAAAAKGVDNNNNSQLNETPQKNVFEPINSNNNKTTTDDVIDDQQQQQQEEIILEDPSELPSTKDSDLPITSSSSSSLLPPGWVELIHEDSGLPYYFNENDGLTTWDRPTIVKEEEKEEEEVVVGEIDTNIVEPERTTTNEVEDTPDNAVVDDAVVDQQQIDHEKSSKELPSTSLLPPGWVELIDEGSGLPYYLNEKDGITTWDRPKIVVVEEKTDDVIDNNIENDLQQQTAVEDNVESTPEITDIDSNEIQKQESSTAEESNMLPPGWVEIIDEDSGLPYYLNETEGVTTWDRPSTLEKEEKVDNDISNILHPEELTEEVESTPEMGEEDVADVNADNNNEIQKEISSSPQESASILPPGWVEIFDEDSGLPYYLNESEGITTWERPVGTLEEEQVDIDNNNNDEKDSYQKETGTEEVDSTPSAEKMDDGDIITANVNADISNKIQQQKEESSPEESATSIPVLPSGWMELIDEDSGVPYYLNENEGITTWDRPTIDDNDAVDEEEEEEEIVVDDDNKASEKIIHDKSKPDIPPDNAVETTTTPELDARDIITGNSNNNNVTDTDNIQPEEMMSALLPEGWVEIIDEDTGMSYYLNEDEGITTWDRPTARVEEENADVAVTNNQDSDMIDGNDETYQQPIPEPETTPGEVTDDANVNEHDVQDSSPDLPVLPPGWVELIDEDSGLPYYLNEDEGITTWDRPALIKEDDEDVAEISEQPEAREETEPVTDTLRSDDDDVADNAADIDQELDQESPALPPGWVELIDEDSGLPYYLNGDQGISTWDRPIATEEEEVSVKVDNENDVQPETTEVIEPTPEQEKILEEDEKHEDDIVIDDIDDDMAVQEEIQELPPGWVESFDEDSGMPFYINESQGITTWDRPEISLEEEKPDMEIDNQNFLPDATTDEVEQTSDAVIDDKADEGIQQSSSELPVLPPGWVELVDETSGLPYYLNEDEGITSWERPVASNEEEVDAVENENDSQPEVTDEVDSKPDLSGKVSDDANDDEQEIIQESELPALPPGWVEIIDEASGLPYYLHELEGMTTWERPILEGENTGTSEIELEKESAPDVTDAVGPTPETLTSEAPSDSHIDENNAEESELPALPSGWVELVDEDSGLPYYLNEDQGLTTWDRPVASEENEAIAENDNENDSQPEITDINESTQEPGEDILDNINESDQEITQELELPVLPPGWVEVVDETSGQPYYVNEDEGITTWERPVNTEEEKLAENENEKQLHPESTDVVEPALDAEIDGDITDNKNDADVAESTVEEIQESSSSLPILPPGWVELVDETSGQPYYLNEDEGITTWDRPITGKDSGDSEDVKSPKPEATDEVPTSESGAGGDPMDSKNDDIIDDAAVQDTENLPSELPALPPGWVEIVDEASGQPYYLNEDQGITTWDRPVGVGAVESEPENIDQFQASVDAGNDEGDHDDIHEPATPSDPDELLQANVDEVRDGKSVPEDSAQEVTEEIVSPEQQESPECDSLPPGWTKLFDEDSGEAYYFCEADGTTSWERPGNSKLDDTVNENETANAFVPEETGHEVAETHVGVDTDAISPESTGNSVSSNENRLPHGWIELIDPSTNTTYYYNKLHDLTSWERPTSSTQSKHRKPGRGTFALASFGFGGKLCILRPGRTNPSSLQIYRTNAVVRQDEIVDVESFKRSCGVTGALRQNEGKSVLSYIERKSCLKNDLIWRLVDVIAQSKGKLRTSTDIHDPSSSQAKIVKLLVGDSGSHASSEHSNGQGQKKIPAVETKKNGSSYDGVEKYLLVGKREEAVREALVIGDYALAVIMSLMCGTESYHHAVKCYADNVLSSGQPLHTLSLLFSNQLLQGCMEGSTGSVWSSVDANVLLKTWKRNSAAIYSNPVDGWEKILSALGDQMLHLGDVEAAHVCYLLGRCSVGSPFDSRLTLLGCEVASQNLMLASEESVRSFERTEAYEWAKRLGNPNASIRSLQNSKFMYAKILTDYGLVEEAMLYLESIAVSLGYSWDELLQASLSNIPMSMVLLTNDPKALLGLVRELGRRLCGEFDAKDSVSICKENDGKIQTTESSVEQSVDENNEVDTSFVTAKTNLLDTTGSPEVENRPRRTPLRPIGEEHHSHRPPQLAERSGPNDGERKREQRQEKPIPSVEAMQHSEEPPLITPVNRQTSQQAGKTEPKTTHQRQQHRTPKAPMSAPANLESIKKGDTGTKKKGFFSFGIKDSVTKWLNPDATKADLGEKMEAYYDADRKVWVFPGEDPDDVAKPIGPPPKMMGSSNKQEEGLDSGNKEESKNDENKPLDPLAAMMAPPQRSLRKPGGSRPKHQASPSSMPMMMFPTTPGMTVDTPNAKNGGVGTFSPPKNFTVFAPNATAATNNKDKNSETAPAKKKANEKNTM